MHRAIDAPDQVFSDAKQAAAWLGLTDGEFRAEVKRYPYLLPYRERAGAHEWFWLDLVLYAHATRARGGDVEPPIVGEKSEKK